MLLAEGSDLLRLERIKRLKLRYNCSPSATWTPLGRRPAPLGPPFGSSYCSASATWISNWSSTALQACPGCFACPALPVEHTKQNSTNEASFELPKQLPAPTLLLCLRASVAV